MFEEMVGFAPCYVSLVSRPTLFNDGESFQVGN